MEKESEPIKNKKDQEKSTNLSAQRLKFEQKYNSNKAAPIKFIRITILPSLQLPQLDQWDFNHLIPSASNMFIKSFFFFNKKNLLIKKHRYGYNMAIQHFKKKLEHKYYETYLLNNY